METLTDIGLRLLGGYGDRPGSFSSTLTDAPLYNGDEEDEEEDELLDPGYVSIEKRRIRELIDAVKAQRAKNEQEDMERLAIADIPPARGRSAKAPAPSAQPGTGYTGGITTETGLPSWLGAVADARETERQIQTQVGEGLTKAVMGLGASALSIGAASTNIFGQALQHAARTGMIDPNSLQQGLFGIRGSGIPQFDFSQAMELFKRPMERVPKPTTPGGQVTYEVLTFPFAVLNTFSEYMGNLSRRMGADDNTAQGVELAFNLLGYSELFSGAKTVRGKIARIKTLINKGKLDDPAIAEETARLAAMIEDIPDSPFKEAAKFAKANRRGPTRNINLLKPTPDTGRPVTPEPPPVTPETPAAPSTPASVFDVTAEDLGTVTPDQPPTTRRERRAARKQAREALESTPTETQTTGGMDRLAQIEKQLQAVLRTTPTPETHEIVSKAPNVISETPVETTPESGYVRPERVSVSPDNQEFVEAGISAAERAGAIDEILQRSQQGENTAEIASAIMDRFPGRSVNNVYTIVSRVRQAYGLDQLGEGPAGVTAPVTPTPPEGPTSTAPATPKTTETPIKTTSASRTEEIYESITNDIRTNPAVTSEELAAKYNIAPVQATIMYEAALMDLRNSGEIPGRPTPRTTVRPEPVEEVQVGPIDETPLDTMVTDLDPFPGVPTDAERIAREFTAGIALDEQARYELISHMSQRLGVDRNTATDLVSDMERRGIINQQAPTTIESTIAVESTPQEDLARIRELLANPEERGDALTVLKTITREGKKGRVNYAQELQSIGFTAEEAAAIAPELSSLGSRRKVKPNAELARTSEVSPTELVIQEPHAETPAKAPVIKKAPARKRGPKVTPLMEQNFDGFYDVEMASGAVDTPSDLSRDFLSPASVPEPIIIGYQKGRQGNTPKSVVVNTSGMDITESQADIQQQVADGALTPEQAYTKNRALERKAKALGVDPSQAHLYTPDDVTAKAALLASRKNLDMYILTGEGPKLLSVEARDGIAKLDNGDRTEPSGITPEEADAYIEAKTPTVSEQNMRLIENAIETGEDISAHLPAELAAKVKEIQDQKQTKLDDSKRREILDILTDIGIVLIPPIEGGGPLSGQRGAIGGGPESRGFRRGAMTNEQREAAQRLYADWQRAVKEAGVLGRATVGSFEYFLKNNLKMPDVTATVISDYVTSIDNPPPPDGNIPINMAITPDSGPLFDQRKGRGGRVYPPKYVNEVKQLQDAAKLKKAIVWGEPVLHTLRKFGLQNWWHTYNEQYRAMTLEKRENARTFRRLEKATTRNERRRAAAFLYSLDPRGREVNTANSITPPRADELTPNEANLVRFVQTFAPHLYNRLAESRKAAGRDALDKVDNYLPIMRTFTVAEKLGITPSLLTMPAKTVRHGLQKFAESKFPYTRRRDGKFNAEYDILNILRTYTDAAVDAIHLTPFSMKLNEFINTGYPRYDRPDRNFKLKNTNEDLHEAMHNWMTGMLGIPSLDVGQAVGSRRGGRFANKLARSLSRNVGVAHIAFAGSSVLNQTGALVSTVNEIGLVNTLNGLRYTMADPILRGKNWKFAMRESNVLDTRAFDGIVLGLWGAIKNFDMKNPYRSMLNLGTSVLSSTDMILAISAWHGTYRMYRRAGKDHDAARKLADEMVVRTQGSTIAGDLTAFQRNAFGALAATLQNFAISQFYHFMNDVAGVGQGRSRLVNTWKILKWFGISAIYGSIMNSLFDSENSQPDPIGEFVRSSQNESLDTAMWLAALEVLQVAPGLGGALKYEKGLGGPVAAIPQDMAREPLHGLRVFGVPKTAVELMQGEDPYNAFFRLRRRRRESTRTGL